MTNDPSSYSKRVRKLSLALMASGALNIGVLSLLLFWVVKERPPTPYCELKPASKEQQQVPLADHRGCTEVLAQLSGQTFLQLAAALSHPKLIENGFTERDLALACLMAFHHFDIQRALPKNAQPQQPRYLSWKPKDQAAPIILTVFSDLTQAQFDAMIQFIKTERWPFTGEGLFGLLKKQKEERQFDDHLVETFVLTPEFWTVELLFNRSGQKANRKEMLRVLLEGDWALLSRFVDQQRVAHDSSDARRQKFLLDYINAGSPSAAGLLLKAEWDFALKKIDDHQVIAILRLMPNQTAEGTLYAKEMLASPRSTNVWRESSRWLYVQAGETFPNEWTHHAALAKFVPEKAVLELVTKPPPPLPIAPPPIPIVAVIPDKTVKATPIKPDNPAQPKKVQTKIVKAKEVPKKDQVKRGVDANSKSGKQAIWQNTKSGSVAGKKTASVNVGGKPAKAGTATGAEYPAKRESKPLIYVVQEGDSLWKISRRFNLKVDDIKLVNGLKSDTLKVGMTLKLPKYRENRK